MLDGEGNDYELSEDVENLHLVLAISRRVLNHEVFLPIKNLTSIVYEKVPLLLLEEGAEGKVPTKNVACSSYFVEARDQDLTSRKPDLLVTSR